MAAYSGAGSTHWVLEMSNVWLFACYLLCGCTATLNISTEKKNIYVVDNDHTWWEARNQCSSTFGGDLFVPVTGPVPEDLFRSVESDTYYWLGAMRYSTWMWTVDSTPLYKYIGYITWLKEDGIHISENSVSSCYRLCKEKVHFGLRRDMCYCLDENHGANDASKRGESCPGNLDEVCGDDDGMSIYKLDVALTLIQNGKCGYAERKEDKIRISFGIGDDCEDKTRRYACYKDNIIGEDYDYNCENSVCVSERRTWVEANNLCNLVKLERSTEDYLKTAMQQNKKYWIGLVHGSTKRWITGHATHVHDEYVSSEPRCLAVSFTTRYRHFSWKPCSSPHASICEVVRSKASTTHVTSTPPLSPSSATATKTSEIETPTHQPTTANVPISEENYKSTSNSNSPAVGPTESMRSSKETQTDVFIGLGLGSVVLILVAIIVVLLLMRQNKLCLKKKNKDQPVHFNTVTETTTYEQLDVPVQTDNVYTVIPSPDTTGDKSTSSIVPIATVLPRVQPDNTSRLDDNGGPARTGGQGAGSTGLNNSGLSAGARAPRSSQDEDYDVLGQQDTAGRAPEVYDHMPSGEGDYDTAQQGKRAREVDDSYSHIGRTNRGFEEDAYEVARASQTEDRRDDTYNNIAMVNDNAGDTTDYYNTRSLVGDNNESLGREDDTPENTDIYMLAKGISNA